jgi:signal transduction histidine kinase
MVQRVLAKLRAIPRTGERSDRASILLPFLIISIGLGVLAWRSYVLSARMESGVQTLAMQYAGYSADITARRVDAALRSELTAASEEWQQTERRERPTAGALQEWIDARYWMVSAIFIPDADPAKSIFTSKPESTASAALQTREFFTSSGLVRYTYDPALLINEVRGVLHQNPLMQSHDLRQQAELSIIATPKHTGVVKIADGYAFIAPLTAPTSAYAVRSVVHTGYGATGWENARYISVIVSLIAVVLTALGAYLALRGVKREAETMTLRGALIANVSHELRTPLAMIRLGAETLKRSAKLNDTQRHEIEDSILRETLHLSHLVENVLDIARIHNRKSKALALTPVFPRDLVSSVVTTYESWIRSKGFEVALSIEDSIEEQLWDRDAVSRALLNLIDNAIKYSGDEKSIGVSLLQSADHVIIEVRDRGIGIDAADLEHIFEPYYRAQFSDTQTRRGAGLGLTLVQQIVSSHGGRVDVSSARGSGSTFRMLFPRTKAQSPASVPALNELPQAF